MPQNGWTLVWSVSMNGRRMEQNCLSADGSKAVRDMRAAVRDLYEYLEKKLISIGGL